MLMKINRLIENRNEARMLLKVKEIIARSSAGVIWNGISFEKTGHFDVWRIRPDGFCRDVCDPGVGHQPPSTMQSDTTCSGAL